METPDAPASDRPLRVALLLAVVIAAAAWTDNVRRGAHLLHFDAKAHLVVARRTVDSLTPGWTQLGAVWLPLPHIVNALPAQVDALYTSGLFASGVSGGAFLAGIAALAWAVRRATGDPWAGVVTVAVLALNPGWLYLQSTPLIEALFLGTTAVALAGLLRWRVDGRPRLLALATVAAGLACWVRYEAWPLMALAMTWTALTEPPDRRRRVAMIGLGLGVVVPILAYGLHSWAATGVPFYAIGSENLTERRGDVGHALGLAGTGLWQAFGGPLVIASALAFVVGLRRVARQPMAALAWIALAPLAVTLTAYLAGHPPKARYALLLAPAGALALADATARRRLLQGTALVATAAQWIAVPRPLPVLREATRDRAAVAERLPVLETFRREYRGGRILASMGSLAPVLYELGQSGVPLREVVHEGNGSWWSDAVVDPEREVGWIVIAQGDILDQVRQVRRRFPEGFTPVLGFRGVRIYKRVNDVPGMSAVTAMDPGPGVIN
jgi:hypothetical protein